MSKLYEDNLITISLAENPCTIGHIIVEPKEKVADMQSLSDELLTHLFFGASYAATALFELANAQGTNIILEENSLRINVIAREQNDGLNFLWDPNQSDPAQLQSLAKSIKDDIEVTAWKKNNPTDTQPKEAEVISETEGKVNFLLKSLHRIP